MLRSLCRRCGGENALTAVKCSRCGSAALAKPIAGGETRKVVTVLFSDITGSTAIGEKLDPESVRLVMSRYFEQMKLVLERHGGTVEKFIGDAVMAVFGVPQAHEDDALRGVRAAVEMRKALNDLNEEIRPAWGVTIVTRTGVNTGEVVAGDPRHGQAFVVGDPVTVAARLEQSAPPGAILIGESTFDLVRDAVVADAIEPMMVKGKEEPVPAWSVKDLVPGAAGWSRRLDSPIVGRERELVALDEAFQLVHAQKRPHVITIMGPAGVGKSRLAEQFLFPLGGRATVLRGRCLSYGDGITFWPVLEVIQEAAGITPQNSPDEARNKLTRLLEGAEEAEAIRERLAALLGLGEATPAMLETFWGVRRLFETLAGRNPLVVRFDDVDWGEPVFLDLLEYLASSIRESPVLMLCLARPELLETREHWMAGRANASLVQLELLSTDETEHLIRNLLGGAELVEDARQRISEMAEGNPLFVEETLRMLVDDGALQPENGHWKLAKDLATIQIPATIQQLLAARLDRLEQEERAVIERASVVGRVFWWSAVTALAPEQLRPAVGPQLQSLTRKELVRHDFSDVGLGEAYRFSHILIRDAAYAAIPKATRADLHQRLAAWIEEALRERPGEYDEIVGYHLEQAHRALTDLGMMGDEVRELGRRAAVPLAAAGLRAFARGDMPAAASLLGRAAVLRTREDPERLQLLPPRAVALMETGDFPRFQEVVTEADEAAAASGDPGLQANVAILGLWIRLFTNPAGWAEVAHREAMRVISVFEELKDEQGQAGGWSVLGLVHTMKAQFSSAETAWEQAAEFARQANDRRNELESLAWVPLAVWAGPTQPKEAQDRLDEVVSRASGDKKVLATALFMRAPFEAGAGRTEEARDLLARARAILQEVELTLWIAGPLAQVAGWVELIIGDAEAAERELRSGYETLLQIGDVAWLSTTVAILAETVYRQGRYEEAEELTGISEQTAAPDDVYSQVLWRGVRAKVIARRGDLEAAEGVAREAATLAAPSDFLHLRSFALMSLSEVLRMAAKGDEAGAATEDAIDLFEQKGNDVEAAGARALLEQV